MAVYTNISEEEIEAFLGQYDLGSFVAHQGISDGIENSNYILETEQGKHILTIYEGRDDPDELHFYFHWMAHLSSHGILCPAPIAAKDGEVLRELKGKPAAIMSFLQGKWPRRIKNFHCAEIGKYLAKMHVASAGFEEERRNATDMEYWHNLLQQSDANIDSITPGLAAEVEAAYSKITASWPNDLPQGIIHADLFPDNVLFDGEQVSGILDFYIACTDMFALDVAIVMNAWCFEHETEFNVTKAREMLSAYHKERPFSQAELEALPVLAAGSALRFLLSRLYDWFNTPEDALVTRKDPCEYLEKLRFHFGVKSVSEYGLEL